MYIMFNVGNMRVDSGLRDWSCILSIVFSMHERSGYELHVLPVQL